jgi:hypothetical protein
MEVLENALAEEHLRGLADRSQGSVLKKLLQPTRGWKNERKPLSSMLLCIKETLAVDVLGIA